MHSAMANAMLEEDFKSSHPDLTAIMDQHREDDNKNSNNKTILLPGGGEERIGMQQRLGASPMRKSVEFAMEPPPVKRSRPDVPWTAKQVVDGTCLFFCWLAGWLVCLCVQYASERDKANRSCTH